MILINHYAMNPATVLVSVDRAVTLAEFSQAVKHAGLNLRSGKRHKSAAPHAKTKLVVGIDRAITLAEFNDAMKSAGLKLKSDGKGGILIIKDKPQLKGRRRRPALELAEQLGSVTG
jgi:hypothetical protein